MYDFVKNEDFEEDSDEDEEGDEEDGVEENEQRDIAGIHGMIGADPDDEKGHGDHRQEKVTTQKETREHGGSGAAKDESVATQVCLTHENPSSDSATAPPDQNPSAHRKASIHEELALEGTGRDETNTADQKLLHDANQKTPRRQPIEMRDPLPHVPLGFFTDDRRTERTRSEDMASSSSSTRFGEGSLRKLDASTYRPHNSMREDFQTRGRVADDGGEREAVNGVSSRPPNMPSYRLRLSDSVKLEDGFFGHRAECRGKPKRHMKLGEYSYLNQSGVGNLIEKDKFRVRCERSKINDGKRRHCERRRRSTNVRQLPPRVLPPMT
eukprot:CAMPEP_0185796778 /NCGR_PEP_ID=MMETSP1174-20130828/161267_1 /TAXON_ID=35687 /ORGANISM="Dictyocha speculum, Strain CCMP1381" /LENGTH=324 /DNA_ID=CAMNT_0028492171 /DNA_START=105 /DNA_END=1079 /DNA_ORIENTATION=+